MLQVMASFIPEIPNVNVDGIYGPATRAAVLAAQRRFRLPETGTVGSATWDEIYSQYSGIENTVFRNREQFPQYQLTGGAVPAALVNRSEGQKVDYRKSTTLTQYPGAALSLGAQDPIRQEVVR